MSYGTLNYKKLISVPVTFFRVGKIIQHLKIFPFRLFLLERNSLINPLRHYNIYTSRNMGIVCHFLSVLLLSGIDIHPNKLYSKNYFFLVNMCIDFKFVFY